MKLIYTNIYEPSFDCDCCGTCWPEHYTISLSVGEANVQVYEYEHDGHMGGDEFFYGNNTNVVGAMRDALLDMYSKNDSQADDYQRNSILGAYEAVEVFANTMYSKWLGVKAYGLALEDDGWDISYEEM